MGILSSATWNWKERLWSHYGCCKYTVKGNVSKLQQMEQSWLKAAIGKVKSRRKVDWGRWRWEKQNEQQELAKQSNDDSLKSYKIKL